MCYIMIVKKLNTLETRLELDKSIRDTIKAKFASNRDGFWLSSKSASSELRTLDKTEAEAALDSLSLDSLIVHARTATQGATNIDNVHGWTLNGWQFAHNGQVFTAESKLTDTDSLILFRELVANVDSLSTKKVSKAIRRVMASQHFWGRACLYHIPTDRMFLLGDWYTYLIASEYVLISSADLNLSEGKTIRMHGMQFEQSTGTAIAEELIDGLAVIERFSQPDFHYKHLGALETASYTQPQKHQPYVYSSYLEDSPAVATQIMKDQRGQLVEVFEDSIGMHDIYYDCCMLGTCDLFVDATADELASYYAGSRTEIYREPILL